MNFNLSDTSDSDRFKHYFQAVKTKAPVYERVNLLLSDRTDDYFEGSQPISKDEPDLQRNYNVFVGCISFNVKQLMSQHEFLNRAEQTDNFYISPSRQENILNSIENEYDEQSSMFAGDSTNFFDFLREERQEMDRLTGDVIDTTDCCDGSSTLNSMADQPNISNLNGTFGMDSQPVANSTLFESEATNCTMDVSNSNETNGNVNCAGTITTISGNESQTIHTHSEIHDDTRNIIRIDEKYLESIDIFRLPLNILQQEIEIDLSIFGIPSGKLKRQGKFTLPKDYGPLRAPVIW